MTALKIVVKGAKSLERTLKKEQKRQKKELERVKKKITLKKFASNSLMVLIVSPKALRFLWVFLKS